MCAEPMKLNVMVCTAFVFAYLWSIGANILDKYWDAFDTFVRSQFEDCAEAKVPHCIHIVVVVCVCTCFGVCDVSVVALHTSQIF